MHLSVGVALAHGSIAAALQDDDYSANSDGKGQVVVSYDEEATVAQQLRPQHPALVGAATEAGATEGAPFPGFWNQAVPENSPLADVPPAAHAPQLPDSPCMVSMELTNPTLAVQAPLQYVPGEVTAGLPSLGALADAEEEEDAAAWQQQQQQQQTSGEVTAALPSLGALAEADEEEEEAGAALQQQEQPTHMPGEVTAVLPTLGALAEADEMEEGGGPAQQPTAGWAHAAAAAADLTMGNITAALPGLGSLVEEDEEDAAGMDLTMPVGRVLENREVQQEATAAAELAQPVQQSPASTAVLAAAAPIPAQLEAAEQGQQQAEPEAPQDVQTLAPAAAEVPAAEVDPEAAAPVLATARRSTGRFSLGGSSTDEMAGVEAARALQLNKWGFAPGQEDTLDINLEMHGGGGRREQSAVQLGTRMGAACLL